MSKTTFAKTVEDPKVGPYRFSHYNVDPVFCRGRLTAYAMGRLLQRLEWHHQQWIVLLAELCCEHKLPVDLDGDREPLGQTDEHAELEGDGPPASEAERQAAFELLDREIRRECGAQNSFAQIIKSQLQALYCFLPTGAVASMERRAKELLQDLFVIDREDLSYGSEKLSNELRIYESDERFELIREEGLGRILRRLTFASCDQLADRLRTELKEDDFNYFTLGRCLESALCPPEIYKQMATTAPLCLAVAHKKDWMNLPEQIARAAGYMIGYHAFAPGSLKVGKEWREQIERTLTIAGAGINDLQKVLEGTRNSAKRRATKESPQEDWKSAFTCQYPPAPDLLTTVAKIHDQVAAQLGCSVPTSQEEVQGAFGECLQIVSKNKAVLRTGGREDLIISGRKLVPLVTKFVLSKGKLCTLAELNEFAESNRNKGTGKPYQNLHSLVKTLIEPAKKAGFTIDSKYGEGYTWRLAKDPEPADQSSQPKDCHHDLLPRV